MRDLSQRDANTIGLQALARGIQSHFRNVSFLHAVDAFIRSHWVTVPDPPDAEFVRSPARQLRALEAGQPFEGDCDDAATLICSILAALNVSCWFIAIRFPDQAEFSHVWAQAGAAGYHVDLDPVVPLAELPIVGYTDTVVVPVSYGEEVF